MDSLNGTLAETEYFRETKVKPIFKQLEFSALHQDSGLSYKGIVEDLREDDGSVVTIEYNVDKSLFTIIIKTNIHVYSLVGISYYLFERIHGLIRQIGKSMAKSKTKDNTVTCDYVFTNDELVEYCRKNYHKLLRLETLMS